MALVPIQEAERLSRPSLTGLNNTLTNLANIRDRADRNKSSSASATAAAMRAENKRLKDLKTASDKMTKDMNMAHLEDMYADYNTLSKNLAADKAVQMFIDNDTTIDEKTGQVIPRDLVNNPVTAMERSMARNFFETNPNPAEVNAAYLESDLPAKFERERKDMATRHPKNFNPKWFEKDKTGRGFDPAMFSVTSTNKVYDVLKAKNTGQLLQAQSQAAPRRQQTKTKTKAKPKMSKAEYKKNLDTYERMLLNQKPTATIEQLDAALLPLVERLRRNFEITP